MDPDRRIQESIHLAFSKMTELGSVRQVLLWFRREKIAFPTFSRERGERRVVWKLPVYNNVLALLTNPLYAGAYTYGRRETRTRKPRTRRVTCGGRRCRRCAVGGEVLQPFACDASRGGVCGNHDFELSDHASLGTCS
jgi:hypothetical protein